jgi:hypothetical protein
MRVPRSLWIAVCAAVFAFVIFSPQGSAHAQTRINDKDLERIMKNLRDDAKDFRSAFDNSLHKSAIRNTSREKDAKELAERFEKQSDEMWKHFKGSKKADTYVSPVVDLAGELDRLVYSLNLDSKTTLSWEKTRSELHQIANSYGVSEPYLQNTAVLANPGDTGSCAASVGSAQAQRLVERCTRVSTATHSPCNAQNTCALITDEIRHGCSMLSASDAPGFCSEYR